MTQMMRWARTCISSGTVPAIDLLRLFEVYKTSGALHFIVGRRRPPERRQRRLNKYPQARKEKVHSVASQVAGRMKELRSVHLEHVLQIVDSPGYHH